MQKEHQHRQQQVEPTAAEPGARQQQCPQPEQPAAGADMDTLAAKQPDQCPAAEDDKQTGLDKVAPRFQQGQQAQHQQAAEVAQQMTPAAVQPGRKQNAQQQLHAWQQPGLHGVSLALSPPRRCSWPSCSPRSRSWVEISSMRLWVRRSISIFLSMAWINGRKLFCRLSARLSRTFCTAGCGGVITSTCGRSLPRLSKPASSSAQGIAGAAESGRAWG